jgi:hypothetical protein
MISTVFLALVSDDAGGAAVRTLIESLRAFGGPFADAPVWVFGPRGRTDSAAPARGEGVRVVPLDLDEALRSYPFAHKVLAAATAAELLPAETRTVVWLDSEALILKPPSLLETSAGCRAALRPVHIRNVGMRIEEPLDAYWARIYSAAGLEDPRPRSVQSFVDDQAIRPYFNCGAYSLDPSMGIFRLWWKCFEDLVRDARFQQGACGDEPHRIFLHQAVLSALITRHVPWHEIRLLPPGYGYPLHFHGALGQQRRELPMDDLACPLCYHVAARDRESMWRRASEPLRSWLLEHAATVRG